jgi:hypothetical protein
MSYLYDPTRALVPVARVLCSAEGEGQPGGGTPPAAAGSSSASASGSGAQPSAEQLKELIARERDTAVREVLKQLGFKTVEEAAGALKRGKELESASKTELERLREAAAKVEPLSQESSTLRGAVEQYLKAEIEALPEDKRVLVDELGPPADQPAARLEWLAKAKKKGLFTAAAPAPAPPAAAVTEQRPANTRAGSGAPPPPAANQSPQKKRPIEMTPAERQQALAVYQAEQASRTTPRQ